MTVGSVALNPHVHYTLQEVPPQPPRTPTHRANRTRKATPPSNRNFPPSPQHNVRKSQSNFAAFEAPLERHTVVYLSEGTEAVIVRQCSTGEYEIFVPSVGGSFKATREEFTIVKPQDLYETSKTMPEQLISPPQQDTPSFANWQYDPANQAKPNSYHPSSHPSSARSIGTEDAMTDNEFQQMVTTVGAGMFPLHDPMDFPSPHSARTVPSQRPPSNYVRSPRPGPPSPHNNDSMRGPTRLPNQTSLLPILSYREAPFSPPPPRQPNHGWSSPQQVPQPHRPAMALSPHPTVAEAMNENSQNQNPNQRHPARNPARQRGSTSMPKRRPERSGPMRPPPGLPQRKDPGGHVKGPSGDVKGRRGHGAVSHQPRRKSFPNSSRRGSNKKPTPPRQGNTRAHGRQKQQRPAGDTELPPPDATDAGQDNDVVMTGTDTGDKTFRRGNPGTMKGRWEKTGAGDSYVPGHPGRKDAEVIGDWMWLDEIKECALGRVWNDCFDKSLDGCGCYFKKLCRHFQGVEGCRRGGKCRFLHPGQDTKGSIKQTGGCRIATDPSDEDQGVTYNNQSKHKSGRRRGGKAPRQRYAPCDL